MGIEERVPEFVEEALRARQAAAGLTTVLKMLPQDDDGAARHAIQSLQLAQ